MYHWIQWKVVLQDLRNKNQTYAFCIRVTVIFGWLCISIRHIDWEPYVHLQCKPLFGRKNEEHRTNSIKCKSPKMPSIAYFAFHIRVDAALSFVLCELLCIKIHKQVKIISTQMQNKQSGFPFVQGKILRFNYLWAKHVLYWYSRMS